MAVAEQPRTLVETPSAGWYIDPSSGKKVRKRKVDKTISQAAYEKLLKGSDGNAAKIYISDTGKALLGPTTTIKCVECGQERVVKVQDKHQVRRCAEHQRAHRNAVRRQKRAEAKSASSS